MRQSKWYIRIDGKKQGPYTISELKDHPFVTPFTHAKKKVPYSKSKWRMMGQIAELRGLFQRTELPKHRKKEDRRATDILVGSAGAHMGSFLVWSILAILAILFIIFTFTSHGR